MGLANKSSVYGATTNRSTSLEKIDLPLACLLIALWLAYLLLHLPEQPIMVPDSISYINFYSSRSAGYPLFLMITGIKATIIIQTILAAISLFILYLELRKLFVYNRIIALLIILAIGLNTRFFQYHYSIMTESLYVSFLIIIVALHIRFVRMPADRITLLGLSILIGIEVSIRPSAIFLFPAIIISLLLVWLPGKPNWRLLVFFCIIPFLSIIASEKIFNSLWHDGQSSSLFTRHAFAKAALISAPHIDSSSKYDIALQKKFASTRKFIWSAPGFYVRNHFLTNYEICIQYGCSKDEKLNLDSVLAGQAAIRRIRSNITGYLLLAWHNYRSLWTVYPTSTPRVASAIKQYLDANQPIPFITKHPWLAAEVPPPSNLKFIIQMMIQLTGVISASMLLLGFYQLIRRQHRSQLFAVVVFVSLSIQGSQLLTALTGVSVIRYTITLWPLFIVCLAGTLAMVFKKNISNRFDSSA